MHHVSSSQVQDMTFIKIYRVSLILSLSASLSRCFLFPQMRTACLSKTSKDFIHVDRTVGSKPDVSVVVLPGTLVPPYKYEPVCSRIGSICQSKNITADVSIAKFTLNAGHRFEARSISDKIRNESRSDNIVIVGHSASAVVGADIASMVNATGFVQWCGTFNSNGDFPWDSVDPYRYDTPTMAILSENDALFSFPIAAREFCSFGNSTNKVIPTSIPDAGHFSGVYMEDRKFKDLPRRLQNTIERTGTYVDDLFDMSVVSVAWRVSEFIGHLKGLPVSSKRIQDMQMGFRSRFGELCSTQSKDDVKSMIYGRGYSDSSVYHTHTQHPPGFLYALLYAAFPELRSFITVATVVMPFIFTYPSDRRSISISSTVNPLPGSTFSNPSIWAKIPHSGPDNLSRKVNSATFEKALSEVSKEDRNMYYKYGKPLVFTRDTPIPKVPGCGLLWVCSPLVIGNEESYASVSSPVVKMEDKNTLNTKLISRKQCLEWILVGCFK